jgi:general secretion pathway protein C
MGSWAIMALNIALFGGSCFLVANVATQIAAEVIEPDGLEPLPPTHVESSSPQHAAAPSVILERNLFGAQLAGDAQITDAPTNEPLVKTKLPLRLLGTAAANAETRSRAAIENERTRKHMIVAVGDRIDGHDRVRVDAIERTRVILDNAGQPEELLLHEDQPNAARASARPAPRQARRRPAAKDNTARDRLTSLAGEGGDGISKLLSQARISPHISDGEMLGMKIDAIKSGSLFEHAGLENGDIITEVNGIVIDRQDATPAVLEELMNAETIEIAALRGDSAIQLTAEAAEIMEQP